jgi:CRISPR-associated protein Csm5
MREHLMTNRRYEVSCLGPVHIGTGRKFTRFDGFARDRLWWLIDLDRVLVAGDQAYARDLAIAMRDEAFTWTHWFTTHKLKPKEFAAYTLPCWQDPAGREVREAIKDAWQRPYLPGSSLKGAIRTALLWQLSKQQPGQVEAYVQRTLHPGKDKRPPAKEWFAQNFERQFLGEQVVTDLLKTLHVGDSAPVALSQMIVGETSTFTLRQNKLNKKGDNFRIFAEWLKPETKLAVEIGVNEFLLSDERLLVANQRNPTTPRQELGITDERKAAVTQFAACCNTFAQALLTREKDFFRTHQLLDLVKDCERLEREISELAQKPGSFVLRIGWGGGWESKTLGDQVRAQLGTEEFRELRAKFQNRDYLDSYFPHSRQLATAGAGPAPRALGWVKLEIPGDRQ